jgi:hypothetical protein
MVEVSEMCFRNWPGWAHRERVYSLSRRTYMFAPDNALLVGEAAMRAETQKLADSVAESLGLLRRSL